MKAKILFVSDLHKRDIDFSSIKGYTNAVDLVQLDIINFIQQQGITHFISLGDWYDKGYRNIGRSKNDDNLDRTIAEAVNGNAYINLGNHFYIEKDQNPEMYMIQPNPKYQPFRKIYSSSPIFKAVDDLVIGTVQISFFHFNKENKLYINERKPGVTYHIGIYHDDCVVPSNVRKRAGYEGSTSSDYLETVLSNVDLAIVGHIHVKIGIEKITLNSGKIVPMIIPGALAVVQNKDIMKHKDVQLPVLCIEDDNKVSCKLYSFSTHLDMLKFYSATKEGKRADGAPEPLQGMHSDISHTEYQASSITLKDYIKRKGYGDNYLNVVDASASGTLDLISAIKLLS